MPLPDWFAGYLVGIVAVQLLVLGVLLRRRSGGSEDDEAATGSVECPECASTNHARYRFCRDCAAELPGSSGTVGAVLGGG